MEHKGDRSLRILWGGIFAMAVSLGISRFAYTPILPLMQTDLNFGDDFAGYLGSANYAGYLFGALWAFFSASEPNRAQRLHFNLLLTIFATLGMGLTRMPEIWLLLRFLSGSTSAMVFILSSGVVLEALVNLGKQSWSGWLYSGVGLGIALSAVFVPLFNQFGGWQGGWVGMASLSLPLACMTWFWLPLEQKTAHGSPDIPRSSEQRPSGFLFWLTVVYLMEGLGYIVTATFLVSWLQRSIEMSSFSYLAWFIVGLAAVPSTVLWVKMSLGLGLVKTLILAYLVQALGILLPIFSSGLFGALGGAVFFGGTFVGIAAMSIILGKSLDPQRPDRAIALLTAAFGLGQMAGPALAGWIAQQTQSFTLPLIGASGIIVLGAVGLGVGSVRFQRSVEINRH